MRKLNKKGVSATARSHSSLGTEVVWNPESLVPSKASCIVFQPVSCSSPGQKPHARDMKSLNPVSLSICLGSELRLCLSSLLYGEGKLLCLHSGGVMVCVRAHILTHVYSGPTTETWLSEETAVIMKQGAATSLTPNLCRLHSPGVITLSEWPHAPHGFRPQRDKWRILSRATDPDKSPLSSEPGKR